MIDDILEELNQGFDSTLKALRRDLAKVRTGRANPAILEGIKVDYYGVPTPLNQVGSVKVADARMLTISPWEKSMVNPIEKAIVEADLGLNPSNDGNIVRVPIPPLTGERRRDLTRQVKRSGEDAKIALRNHRRDANELLKGAQKDGDISEDEMHRNLTKVQDITNEFAKKIDEIITEKEKEIMEI